MNIFLDIETIPKQPESSTKAEIAKTIKAPAAMKKKETIDAWHNGEDKYAGVKEAAIEHEYRKTGLDGGSGQIISIAYNVGENTQCIHQSEISILINFFDNVDDALCMSRAKERPFFIGHNIPFDLKFIWHRAVINSVKPCVELPFDGRHGKEYFDTMQAWAGFKGKISQDNLCKALGLEQKPSDINGANVWDHYKAGDMDRIAEYNMCDVNTVIKIYNRLNFKV